MSEQLKIFIIENDPAMLESNINHFVNKGYSDVTGFSHGETCLERLDYNPDVILLGNGLAQPSGAQILEKVKQYDPQIFVIFINSKRQFKMAVQMLKIGQFNYFLKRVGNGSDRLNFETYKETMRHLSLGWAQS